MQFLIKTQIRKIGIISWKSKKTKKIEKKFESQLTGFKRKCCLTMDIEKVLLNLSKIYLIIKYMTEKNLAHYV